jgi:tRNA uridine 5-carboxymethylaminomethyl modification enzyme
LGYDAGEYDIAVIGAGHAGCEAALAAARLGMKTLLFSISLECIANMPCNPHIGGSSKGHLVREIDALGGEMGKNTDKTLIQLRMLNTSKGPAVHSLRAQADRKRYQTEMKHTLEKQENLYIKQAEIVDFEVEDGKIKSVTTNIGAKYKVKAIIVATGTYLKGKIFIGESSWESGPDGVFPANKLSEALKRIGVKIQRFKTGTPARINKNSIDFSKMEIQEGDIGVEMFSFEDGEINIDQVPCWLTYTNEKTHEIIRKNLHRSPLYAGLIEGTGPRYCPSIEDKVVRFADKERHQIFVEPIGLDTDEMYIQGMSSSLPEDVQIAMYRTLPGLEHCEFTRPAYAIEYDCIEPDQLKSSLELKEISGLFFAGQVNGTSGYEEAASQGLIAGINAVQKLKGKPPVILDRSEAYIGVLIDDIITKGTMEPYRMMTSRAEYRLLLRQDNADLRLTEIGHEVGLISDERYEKFLNKKANIEKEIERLKQTNIKPNKENNEFLVKMGTSEITAGVKLSELLKRTELTYESLAEIDKERPDLDKQVQKEVEIMVKYEGYIEMQKRQVESFKKMEKKLLPEDVNYEEIKGLRLEARQKLNKIKPYSVGQASRISGVSPADISILLIFLEQYNRNKKNENKSES